MVGENFEIYCSQMAKNALKLSTMVEENSVKFTALICLKTPLNFPPCLEKIFKFTALKCLKNTFKLSLMVGEKFEIHSSQMAKNAFKLSPMVEEKFEIHSSQMAKNANNVGRAHNVGQGETLDQFSGVAIIAPPLGWKK